MSLGQQRSEILPIKDGGDQSPHTSEHNVGVHDFAKHFSGPEGAGDRGAYAATANERTEASRNKLADAGVLPSFSINVSDLSSAKLGSPLIDTALSATSAGGQKDRAAGQFADAGTVLNDSGSHKKSSVHYGKVAVNLVGGSGDPNANYLKELIPNGNPVPYPATLHDYPNSLHQGVEALKTRIKEDCSKNGSSHSVGYSQGAHVIHTAFEDLAHDKATRDCKMSANLYAPPDGDKGIIRKIREIAPGLVPDRNPASRLSANQHINNFGHHTDPVYQAPNDPLDVLGALPNHALDSYGRQIVSDNARRK